MGQINLVRYGRKRISAGGVITLTTGILAHNPSPQVTMLTMINLGLEGFVEAVAQDRVVTLCKSNQYQPLISIPGQTPFLPIPLQAHKRLSAVFVVWKLVKLASFKPLYNWI